MSDDGVNIEHADDLGLRIVSNIATLSWAVLSSIREKYADQVLFYFKHKCQVLHFFKPLLRCVARVIR